MVGPVLVNFLNFDESEPDPEYQAASLAARLFDFRLLAKAVDFGAEASHVNRYFSSLLQLATQSSQERMKSVPQLAALLPGSSSLAAKALDPEQRDSTAAPEAFKDYSLAKILVLGRIGGIDHSIRWREAQLMAARSAVEAGPVRSSMGEAMQEMLLAGDPYIRVAAAEVLQHVDPTDREHVPVLKSVVEGDDKYLSERARGVLGQSGR